MNLVEQQRKFFETGRTLEVDYRLRQLSSLYHVILQYEEKITEALYQDLSKSAAESYLTEIGMVLSEISYAMRHLRGWARPRRAGGSVGTIFSTSRVLREPYGTVLILAPWNYPFQLSLSPLVSALAAGNCAIIKPSEYAKKTGAVISEMLNNNFEERLCAAVTGGPETARELLAMEFDYIFFTGSREVGRKVYEAAAKNIIPVTLELGGKSPCIVEKTADLDLAARKIVWGKFLNAGQTCVAPDYLLVQDCVKDALVDKMRAYITMFYSETPEQNPNYPKIITPAHFERLSEMLDEGCIVAGGQKSEETQKIAPTILENAPFYSKLMNDEIFGPLLPVMEFSRIEQALEYISLHSKPLALYLFTQDGALERRVIKSVPFGGGCVNDTVMHTTAHSLPFGGVGGSGMGSYHGKAGFDTFTHQKSVLKKHRMFDFLLRYPPYDRVPPILKKLMR